MALPTIQDLYNLMTQVFPGVSIDVTRVRAAAGQRILLGVQLDGARLLLAALEYEETQKLALFVRLYLTDSNSRVVLEEKLDLSIPSDLTGGPLVCPSSL